jgi:hypothetical protein
MAYSNEIIVQQIFNEMLKNKPNLQKVLVADDDSDGEFDIRILGDLIIKNFPWPIGVELRRLFSSSMRQLNRMRLEQIFKTIERTMQFVSFVMICQLWKECSENKITIQEALKKEFKNRMMILTMGNYSWLIRMIGNLFHSNKIDWFLPEMGIYFREDFFNSLDFWVPERNDIGHFQINLTQEEIERRCVEYEEKLSFILQRIAFFSKYRLVSVREIRVIHPKNRQAKFNHLVDILNSSDSYFKAQDIIEPAFTESNSILLMKSFRTLEEYLNLSPLVIDTNSEVIDNKEKFNIKKDVFMYTKMKGDHLMYVGTEVTEKCDLRNLSNYNLLLEQFKDMMHCISGQDLT